MVLNRETLQEAILNLHKEAERDAPPQRRVRDHEIGQPAGGGVRGGVLGRRGGDVVDVVVVVRVGELLRRRVADLGQDE